MLSFLLWFTVSYVWHIFGVTVGLHRLLSHRSFRCHSKLLEYFLVFGAYLAFHGSPVWWAAIHRAHHRHVDTELDPHAPKFKGMFSAYAFYTPMHYPEHIDPKKQCKDLLKDPIYAWLEKGETWHRAYAICVGASLLLRVAIWIAFGPMAALGSLAAGLLALNTPLILNVFCHIPKLGYKNFAIEDDSVNVWWMAIACVGDGWHNNHHAYPASCNMGLRKWEIDPSWLLVKGFEKLHLASAVNETVSEELHPSKKEKTAIAATSGVS